METSASRLSTDFAGRIQFFLKPCWHCTWKSTFAWIMLFLEILPCSLQFSFACSEVGEAYGVDAAVWMLTFA
jgi:hypothetical protein